jgi:hypothetical protein
MTSLQPFTSGPGSAFASSSPASDPALDDQLAEVLDRYLASVESGQVPDPEQVIAEHPLIADRLRRCLASLRFVQHSAWELVAPKDGAEPAAEVPGQLGDYRIVRELGRGGMGVVYEAQQISLDRRVALKVLPLAGLLDPKRLQRFKNEAAAAAALEHSHIVPIYSVGCECGVHYYAMRLIEGQSLSDLINALRQQAAENPPTTASPDVGTARDE